MNLRWPFVCAQGAVSDFGEALRCTEQSSGFVFMLPRYGVWRRRPGDRKWEVIHSTNDYDDAVARASGAASREET